jgi:hypothetical protein
MKLVDLQRDFRLWLASGSEAAARRIPGAHDAGLAVYQNNYRAQLVNCLEASYPLLRARMGGEAFLHLAVKHIGLHPPQAWTLDAYADHLETTLEILFPHNPDLHELAWIELALGTAFVAADAEPITAADLAGVDWDTVRLAMTPSLHTRRAVTNAAAVWRALSAGLEAPEVPEAAMLPAPGALVVWRRDYVSCLREADALEAEALAALQQHGSFAALCDLLAGRLGEDEGIARAGAMLADWIGAGLVSGVQGGA